MFIAITISKPQNFSVSNVKSRSMTISWVAPKDGKDMVTHYSLYYSDGNNTYTRTISNTPYTILNLGK